MGKFSVKLYQCIHITHVKNTQRTVKFSSPYSLEWTEKLYRKIKAILTFKIKQNN